MTVGPTDNGRTLLLLSILVMVDIDDTRGIIFSQVITLILSSY